MPNKTKIKKVLYLLCFPLWGSGSGTYTRELAIEVNKSKNIKTAVACPESKETIAGLKVYPLDLPFLVCFGGRPDWPSAKFYKDLSPKEIIDVLKTFLSGVARAVEDFKPDIIHVQHISLLLWTANIIRSLYGINFVVTEHGTGVLAASQNKTYVALLQGPLKKASKIVLVSRDVKKRTLNLFGGDLSHKTTVISGGIHIDNWPSEKPIKIIDKKYNLQGKKIVLFTGRLTQGKGVYYLLQAAKDIRGDIYIIGDGPEKKAMEDQIVKSKLTNIHLLGYMGDDKKEELQEFYYRANVVVLPSIENEALSLSIVEAMTCKTPIVATRKGGMPSIVKNGVNGFLIRPKNPKQISEACNKLLENEELNKKMGEAARKMVEKRFVWGKIAQKYVRIYKQLANGEEKKVVIKKITMTPKHSVSSHDERE